ncbi:hypothetical protein TNCT_719391 [Trichonephila clavata]|uniref:Uncharacterized protein n=1 Tax=Trichonephila clavata TaxID=2740835 RepID=A0A8X6FTG7_TRICU|nr:hypothetical protein TNCT_719391 [Trichonephila clavata]
MNKILNDNEKRQILDMGPLQPSGPIQPPGPLQPSDPLQPPGSLHPPGPLQLSGPFPKDIHQNNSRNREISRLPEYSTLGKG